MDDLILFLFVVVILEVTTDTLELLQVWTGPPLERLRFIGYV